MVAMVLTMFGTCGVGRSLQELEPTTPMTSDVVAPGTPPELQEVTIRVAEIIESAPERRGLAIANLLASGMLLVGGVLLVTRRKSAPWWITQAAIANLLFTVAEAGAQVMQLDRRAPELQGALDEAMLRMQSAHPEQLAETMTGAQLVLAYKVMFVVLGAVRAFVYLAIAYRIRKPDAAALLAETPD